MLSIYYKVWVDALVFEKSKRGKDINWKTITIISVSVLQGLNLAVLLYLIRLLTHHKMPVLLPVSIFNMYLLNDFVSIILTFFTPFIILNYLLIFYNNRYITLLKKYPAHKGKLYRTYFLWSMGVIIIPVLFNLVFIKII